MRYYHPVLQLKKLEFKKWFVWGQKVTYQALDSTCPHCPHDPRLTTPAPPPPGLSRLPGSLHGTSPGTPGTWPCWTASTRARWMLCHDLQTDEELKWWLLEDSRDAIFIQWVSPILPWLRPISSPSNMKVSASARMSSSVSSFPSSSWNRQ